MGQKNALITGITGQDGSYLAELLLKKGYIVHGLKRRSSSFNTSRIDHLHQDRHDPDAQLFLHYGDITDTGSITQVISKILPDEVYNLAAQSHVAISYENPEYTANCVALGALRVLEAVRALGLSKQTRIYQASTSELYGLVQETPQTELTPFHPRSPYAVAKLYAYWITRNYREAYGFHASNGILFNHESPRRGENFVTRKITRALSRIHFQLQDTLWIGNINAERDWGHAREYVEMQWLILQQSSPNDYVIATGRKMSVRKFIEICAQILGWGGIHWRGSKAEEIGYRADNGLAVIRIDPQYYRPAEVDSLLGDSTKAFKDFGWRPQVTIEQLAQEMIESDLDIARKESILLSS